MLLGLYRTATRLGGPLLDLELRWRVRRGKEEPGRLGERRGRPGLPRPAGPLLWLHAASVGESLAVLPLIEAVLAGDARRAVLLTTGTPSSARLMAGRLPVRALHQFAPIDRPGTWHTFFGHWRPELGLLVESELWPNLIVEAAAAGVPLALVNARLSARSFARWRHAPRSIARLLDRFALCLAQSEADAARLRALGAGRVTVVGNLKWAAAPLPCDETALAALRAAIGARPVWLAASTHAGEEARVLAAHHRIAAALPEVLTMIAPRHPERGAAVAQLIAGESLAVARRSTGALPARADAVYLADTLGELGLLYRVARVAFIGKSLVPGGGQNPLEAALLGCPPLLGPHMGNFAAITASLESEHATRRVGDADQLAATVGALLEDDHARDRLAEHASRAAERARHGVLDATLTTLAPLLEQTLGPGDARP